MSIFHHKTQFTSEQLACAIAGVIDYKEKRDEVRMWEEEIDLAFPPVVDQKRFSNYSGDEYVREEKKYPAISRKEALAFCEQRGIRPPLLFPDNPLDSLTPEDSSQFKESDLLATIYRLLLLVKDLDCEIISAASYSRRRFARGSGVSHKAVCEGIQEILNRLGVPTAGLGETKTRNIFAAACRLGEAASKEKEY